MVTFDPATLEPGQLCRLHGKQTVYKFKGWRGDGTVDLIGPRGVTTVYPSKLAPAKKGDVFVGASHAPPVRKPGKR